MKNKTETETEKFKYTIFDRNEKIVSLDDIKVARKGLKQLGGRAFIKYNEAGIEEYCNA